MACNRDHSSIQDIMKNLPINQGGRGRHKCAACAYEKGYELGKKLAEHFDVGEILDELEDSQAKSQRHKSPHAAFAHGYFDGVKDAYK